MRSHLQMLKQNAGVRSTVPTAILLGELDSRSLEYEWWLCAVRFWNGLAALSPQHLYKRMALDACRAAITSNVRNWAWAMFKGIRQMGYNMVISVTDMVHLDVQRVCQLLDEKVNADKILITALGRVHHSRLGCVQIGHGVLALFRVVRNPMLTCHCLLLASGKCLSLGWVVMACLGILGPGQVFLVLTGSADFLVLALWVMKDMFSLNVLTCNPLGTNMQACFQCRLWCNFSGRMILSVFPSSFVNIWMSCWVLILTIRIRHLISPRWLEKM